MSDYNVREFIEDMIKELDLQDVELMGRSQKVIVSSKTLWHLQQLASIATTVGIENKQWSASTINDLYRWRFGNPQASIFDEPIAKPF